MGKKKKIFITVAVICIILLCFIGIFFLVKHFKNKNGGTTIESVQRNYDRPGFCFGNLLSDFTDQSISGRGFDQRVTGFRGIPNRAERRAARSQ